MKRGFIWDENKARINLHKHSVSFDEAATIFLDPRMLAFHDEEHSEQEFRVIGIGISSRGRILRVVYTERRNEIRLISCRKASAEQRRLYESD